MHISKNSYLAILYSDFIENVAFGRGVIVFSEKEYSIVDISYCNFIRNSGIQGGVFFSDKSG